MKARFFARAPEGALRPLRLLAMTLVFGCGESTNHDQRDAALGELDAATDDAAAGSDAAGDGDDSEQIDAGSSDAGKPTSPLLPPTNAAFDYQLGDAYAPAANVKILSRDRRAAPASGLYNICYVNGFQTQPDEEDFWLQDEPDLVLRDDGGNAIINPDWDEMLLDVSSPAKRQRLAVIVGGWISDCAQAGFDAVEIDNLDTYARSQGRIKQADAVSFIRLLADRAHAAGLAIAQKNAAEILDQREAMGTDFVVSEECNRYVECDVFTEAYGEHVLIIEYRKTDFDKGCKAYPELSIVLRDLDLSGPGSGDYVFEGC